MPVAIDARLLGGGGTGAATYAHGLRAALRLAGADPLLIEDDHLGPSIAPKSVRERAARWLSVIGGRPVRLAERGQGALGARDVFRRAQVHFDRHGTLLRLLPPHPGGIAHWTYPVPLWMEGWANLYTVHDAIPLAAPDLTPIDGRRHRRLLDAIAGGADRLVTVSAAAQRALVEQLGIAPRFISDCSQAVEAAPVAAGPLPAGLVPDGYFLFCGSIEPRKNIAGLVAAWQGSGTALPLVLAGPDGWRADELTAAVAAPGVLRLAYQPRDMLHRLQAHARALLFPSLAEGFGLPIVEAMARGTPVMTSRGGATEEVAGGAALLVDPRDVPEMAAAVGRLDRDGETRDRLRGAGLVRAHAFSAAAFADRLAALYGDVIASKRAGDYPPRFEEGRR